MWVDDSLCRSPTQPSTWSRSSFGALPFVVDITTALREVRRVLVPQGRAAFSVIHPVRRMFLDDPTETGMTITRSYFDRAAYVETAHDGRPVYVEPHHTIGDWVAAIGAAGLVLDQVLEPEWPTGHTRVWGGWGPVRLPALSARDESRSSLTRAQ